MRIPFCLAILAISELIFLNVARAEIPAHQPIIVRGYIYDTDYPKSALKLKQEGTVTLRYLISEMGKAVNCEILSSSNVVALDVTSCKITKRARFKAARNELGRPILTEITQMIAWRITTPCPSLGPTDTCVTAPKENER